MHDSFCDLFTSLRKRDKRNDLPTKDLSSYLLTVGISVGMYNEYISFSDYPLRNTKVKIMYYFVRMSLSVFIINNSDM